jgi:hypothetical protein
MSRFAGAFSHATLELMNVFSLIAERKIREAMDEGAFDKLDGAGQPIWLEENPYEDPAQRIAHRLLRNNGFAPAWIEEAKDIDREIGRLRAGDAARDPEAYRQRIAVLNRRIAAFNLKTPVPGTQKHPLE